MSRRLGAEAERLAADHLVALGYRIVARNVTVKGGELDLVAIDGDSLVFVEVRARARADHGSGDETVGWVKRRRLIFAAQQFLARWPKPDMPCRFDVVSVSPRGIRVVRDAFDLST